MHTAQHKATQHLLSRSCNQSHTGMGYTNTGHIMPIQCICLSEKKDSDSKSRSLPETRPPIFLTGQIVPWTGRIDKLNRCNILKIAVERVL